DAQLRIGRRRELQEGLLPRPGGGGAQPVPRHAQAPRLPGRGRCAAGRRAGGVCRGGCAAARGHGGPGRGRPGRRLVGAGVDADLGAGGRRPACRVAAGPGAPAGAAALSAAARHLIRQAGYFFPATPNPFRRAAPCKAHPSSTRKDRSMHRRLLLGTLALAASAAALPAHALRMPTPDTRAGRWLQVSVVDRATGRELPLYRHGGELWVAGRPGARYAIRVHNRQGERLMAVMSVDGVNILSGETAGVQQTGYVLDAGQRADIAGWRKSDSEIAAFEFTAVARSYASRTGRPDHVGVIGVAVFRERPQPVAVPAPPPALQREQRAEAEAPPAPQAGAAAD